LVNKLLLNNVEFGVFSLVTMMGKDE